jgi:DASS family divalent anion:Na+ symporter
MDIKKLFQKNSVLKNFNDIDLSKLCPYAEKINVKAGERIFSSKQKSSHYYVVDTGSVILKDDNAEITQLTSGESFGDESVFGSGYYLLNAHASEDTCILAIQSIALKRLNSSAELTQLFHNNFLSNNQKELIYQPNIKFKKDQASKKITSLRYLIGWIMSFVVPMIVSYGLSLLDYPPNQSQALLIFIFLSATIMWGLQLVPEFVPALYLLLAMALLSLAPASVTLSGFYSDAFFLALALSALAITVSTSGLSYRVLLYLIKFGSGGNRAWHHFAVFISGAILTPLIPSTNSRVNILYPLFNETTSLFKIKTGSVEYQRLIASTMGGISLLSPVFLTSKSINLITLGMLPTQDQYSFQFYHWFVASSVVFLVLISSYLLFVWLLFRNKENYTVNIDMLSTQLRVLGKPHRKEKFAVISIALFALIILTTNQHNLQISWLTMLLIFFLFTLNILKKVDFTSALDWDFLIFLAALLSFSSTMNYLNLHLWIMHYMSWIEDFVKLGFVQFSAVLSLFIIALRTILPINITVILVVSILLPMAAQIAINPWIIIFITLLMSETYTYNSSASYTMQFFSLIHYKRHHWRLIVLQLIVYVVKFLAIIISIPFWQYLGLLE